ncbi:MAG TPA: hypothetical protein VFM00_13075 [Candidatus Eisenbacteria bacterium]|nr:hypothetical protein [Candidatus Eisenbacteria bacterium]
MRRWVPLVALVLAGCAHAPRTPQERVAVTEEGYAWRLLERRCQGCHALPDPGKYSRERWVKGVERMRKRFAMTPSDWDTLLALVPADSASAIPEVPR